MKYVEITDNKKIHHKLTNHVYNLMNKNFKFSDQSENSNISRIDEVIRASIELMEFELFLNLENIINMSRDTRDDTFTKKQKEARLSFMDFQCAISKR